MLDVNDDATSSRDPRIAGMAGRRPRAAMTVFDMTTQPPGIAMQTRRVEVRTGRLDVPIPRIGKQTRRIGLPTLGIDLRTVLLDVPIPHIGQRTIRIDLRSISIDLRPSASTC